MEIDNIKKIASALFLYNEAITVSKLKEITNLTQISQSEMEAFFSQINSKLTELGLVLLRDNFRDFDKQELMIVVRKEMIDIAQNIKKSELEGELSPATLQVVTIIAYLGGATKSEISFIRGVQSSQSIRILLSRGMIKKDGEKYILTIESLQKMGLTSIDNLPNYEKIKNDLKEKLAEIIITNTDQENITE